MIARCTIFAFVFALLGCGDEWTNAEVGKTPCTFQEWMPFSHRAYKMASGNDGNNLYILDDFYSVHSYKRDGLYECAFDLKESYSFNGIPSNVFFANNSFYIQDGASLKSKNGNEECRAKNGIFALNGYELAVGSNIGIETWNIERCVKNGNISSQNVFALAVTNEEYYAAEGIPNEPQNFVRYPKTGGTVHREPLSATPGNEKNFCSADRIVANNYGVYLLDKKCKKIGVFSSNSAEWRKTIDIDSLGIRNSLDIAAGEHSYIFILHETGVEKINVF